MIVDVITSGIHRVQPVIVPGAVPSEVIHTATELYTAANPNLICQYGDAELSDIRAFGLTSGFVRVMGGVRAALLPYGHGGMFPVPTAPRVYTFFVDEPVLAVAFAPDGLTLGVLYKSCLVVVVNDTRRVFYFGQNHTDTFERLYMSEDFAYVTTSTDEILKFNLTTYDLVRQHVPRSVRTFLSETNEWVSYDEARRLVMFGNGENVLVPAMVGPLGKLVPTLDRNHVWGISNTELVLVCRVEMTTAVLPIQIAPVDDLLVLPYRMGIIIGWYEEPVRILHLKSFEFVHVTGEIVQTGSVSVPFHTVPRALALPASPFTRFNTSHALMHMHRLTRADVVFNQHIFPEPDESNSDTETEDDDDEEEEEEEEEEEVDVVNVSFSYPQPLTGLQLIIHRTREYLPSLCETFAHWTPAQFEVVFKAACVYARPYRLLHQQAAMLLYAKENHKMYAQIIEDTVQKFADFYGGSASMGLLDGSDEIDFEPYASVQSRVLSTLSSFTQTPEEAERVLAAHLKFSETTIGDRLELESLEFRVDMAYHLATQFRGIESDTLHAVNTGIISTLNCSVTEVRDMITSITFQRKLLKILARVMTQQPDVPVPVKRAFSDASGPPLKKLSGDA